MNDISNKLTFKYIAIITVAKVGSANFKYCSYKFCKNIEDNHGHNLNFLKKNLDGHDNLIIVGIRNPIDRNLSYLFQTYKDNIYNDVKTKKNNYKGEYCYIPEAVVDKNKPEINTYRLIELYFKQSYHNTFNEWFEEFLEITDIKSFNKDKGLDFFKFKNNNTIMIYTLEKLSLNEKYICDLLGITNFTNVNNNEFKIYKKLYLDVKNKITYTKKYLDNLLDTKIMRLFYKQEEIDNMYLKYIIKN